LGSVTLGKKDTAKISCSFRFLDAGLEANDAQALLAAGQLHCRLDIGLTTPKLPLPAEDLPPTTVEFDATCHRLSMDMTACSFGLSFPKSAAQANTLADFAGQGARLLVTRTGDIKGAEDGSGDEGDGEE
jgi:hypothetical protein